MKHLLGAFCDITRGWSLALSFSTHFLRSFFLGRSLVAWKQRLWETISKPQPECEWLKHKKQTDWTSKRHFTFVSVKTRDKRDDLSDAVVLLLLSNLTRVFCLFIPPQLWFTHSLLSSSVSLLLTCCVTDVTLWRRNRWTAGADPVTRSPASDRCCGFVIGWRYFYRKERESERQVSRWWMESERLRHSCRLTHTDPHSGGPLSWWLNLSSQWLCTNLRTYCIGVAPDAVSHWCHQGGQQTTVKGTSAVSWLTFKIEMERTHHCSVYMEY